MTPLIRDAGPDDLAAITGIYNALLETTTHEWTETLHTVDERREWLSMQRAHGFPALVAVDDGAVVGWATYGDFRDTVRWPGYLPTVELSIHVHQAHWGRGVGRALIDELVTRARAAGKRVMVAAVDGANHGSIEFHGRVGFRVVGTLPGIGEKFGQPLDLVFMQREL